METLYALRQVSFSYDRLQVLSEISFEIGKGELVGVIGPNGAGKTTLLRLLAGYLAPQKGSVEFLGKDLHGYDKQALARTVATLPQGIANIFPYVVEEFILMGRYPHVDKRFGYGREGEEIVREVMKSMGIEHLRGRLISMLSEGERQKVYLAQCVAQSPRALLLDEPVSHLDIKHQMQTLELLAALNREGLTIVMILHDLNLASEFCSRILLLSQGKIFADGDPGSTLTYQRLEEAYGTVVVVRENPLSGKPFVLPVSKKYLGQ
jgi:iron complex transport system ATP-binding protein